MAGPLALRAAQAAGPTAASRPTQRLASVTRAGDLVAAGASRARLARPASPPRRRGCYGAPRAEAGAAGAGGEEKKPSFALAAPSPPTSPAGALAAYYLEAEPHLFRAAVDAELAKLAEAAAAEAAAAEAAAAAAPPPLGGPAPAELVLSRRVAAARRAERAAALEDLMYVGILARFRELGVEMLPRVEARPEDLAALRALTEGVHTREALALVREHVLGVLGPAAVGFADTALKMSKLQAAQVYAASVMFGYFLRRADARFQLARAAGLLPEAPADAVARLERLFAAADDAESTDDPDAAPAAAAVDPDAPPPPPSADAGGAASGPGAALAPRGKSALRRYVESFDQAAMLATARLVSAEGGALVERQTRALFGDVAALQRAMQEFVGEDFSSLEEMMGRVQKAVADDAVETLTVTVGTQRRLVLEAIAYGVFLRDGEEEVSEKYAALLTPAPAPGGGEGGGGGGGGGSAVVR